MGGNSKIISQFSACVPNGLWSNYSYSFASIASIIASVLSSVSVGGSACTAYIYLCAHCQWIFDFDLNCFVIYIWLNRNNQNEFALAAAVALVSERLSDWLAEWVSQVLNYSTECFACDTINNGWSKLSKSFTLPVALSQPRAAKKEMNSVSRPSVQLRILDFWHVHYT